MSETVIDALDIPTSIEWRNELESIDQLRVETGCPEKPD
jgi:hypothetical protein